jgi:CRP/FNR family transcriptional regulator
MRRVWESTARQLDMAHGQMVLLGRPNARAKVAAFLIDLRARWARTRAASVTVSLPMGRQDIADFLGLSIATVSRTIHRLADERLILIVPKGVRILDFPRLQWAAEV